MNHICSNCTSLNVKKIGEKNFYIAFSPDHYRFTYAYCSCCGFIFNATPPSEGQLCAYYSSPNRWGHIHQVVPASSRKIWQSQYSFLKNGIKEGLNRVIELGCGPGYFLTMLKKRQFAETIDGYELSRKSISYAREKFYLKIIDATTNSIDDVGKTKKYDAVILRHLLEHVPNPYHYLNTLEVLLESDGYIFIEVPSMTSLDTHCQDFPVFEHINYFTVGSLETLLARSYYSVITIQECTYPESSEKPYRVIRVIAKKTDQQHLASKQLTSLSYDKIYAYMISCDYMTRAIDEVDDLIVKNENYNKKYAIYSASNETLHILEKSQLVSTGQCVALFDNNPAKHGKKLCSLPVYSPKKINEIQPDIIVIGSKNYQAEIYQELSQSKNSSIEIIKIFD
jgi:2-polyprenyl-3-methyl-5-hydroxy-6-metoxy-1,4-benzoquinol methylase